jgi:hypothetical protein
MDISDITDPPEEIRRIKPSPGELPCNRRPPGGFSVIKISRSLDAPLPASAALLSAIFTGWKRGANDAELVEFSRDHEDDQSAGKLQTSASDCDSIG